MRATQDAPPTTTQPHPNVQPPVDVPAIEAARPFDWRRIAVQATLVWLAMRVVSAVYTYLGVLFLKQGFDPVQMGLGGPTYPGELFRTWYQWDVGWYLPISNEGYAPDVRRAAFFPLYPLLINFFTQHSILCRNFVPFFMQLL